MSVRYIWYACKPVPHLHVEAGDYLIFEPAGPRVFMVQRPIPHPDFGAIMGAEDGGDLELVSFRPTGSAPLTLVSPDQPSSRRHPRPRLAGRRRAPGPLGAA